MANKIDVKKINEGIRSNYKNYILECEQNYKEQIQDVVNYVANNREVKFILLAGPSSSGKTTTSLIMKKEFEKLGRNALAISLDDFFVEREETPKWEDGTYNYETDQSIDWNLFGRCMVGLLNGDEVKLPTYDFSSGSKVFNGSTKMTSDTIFVIEGLHALNPIINNYIPKKNAYKVHISANTDIFDGDVLLIEHSTVRLFRRIIRDLYTRATRIEKTLESWERVCIGEELYITPFIDLAQYHIDSFHPYEICVYKKILTELDKHDDINLSNIIQKLNVFNLLSDEEVPSDSVLQEFMPKK